MSQRRPNRSIANVAEDDDDLSLDEAVKECIRYIFCREGNKIPIKRADIVKHLSTTCQTPSGDVNAVISRANQVLKKIYGYKLVQMASKSGNQFIVTLTEKCESLPSSNLDLSHRRLLIAALMHIYMTGGAVKEDEMWKFLAEAGLLEENNHNGRKILTNTFTKQMYLHYFKVGEGDLARNVFEWGQRATEEVPKLFLLEKMAKAFDKQPDHWCEQYKEATEEAMEE